MNKQISSTTTIFADLRGHRASENPQTTIPVDLSVSAARPDMVLREGRSLRILELTVCSNTQRGFEEARSRKLHKPVYCQLVADLECRGLQVAYTTLEVGALGHYRPQAVKTLQTMVPDMPRGVAFHILRELGKVAISCSLHIFNARNCTVWPNDKPLFSPVN